MPPHLEKVRDKLAENIHELWGMNKIELGWSFGKVRNIKIFSLPIYLQMYRSELKSKITIHAFCHVCGEINITITHVLNKSELKTSLESIAMSSIRI